VIIQVVGPEHSAGCTYLQQRRMQTLQRWLSSSCTRWHAVHFRVGAM